MRIYIVRHGETEENVAGICQGHLPGNLTSREIEQAELLSERLKKEEFEAIYTSDLDRARHTADIIARHHSTPIQTADLREFHGGSMQGRRKHPGYDWSLVKDRESEEKVKERLKKFLTMISHHEGNILVVTHGAVGSLLISILTGSDFIELKNTSLSIIEESRAELINCIEHLES